MEIKTHKEINQELCGIPIAIQDGEFAVVKLKLTENMKVDEKGLVHGGFIFGGADYCAMLTVNHPNVVLAKAEVKFIKPAKVGEEIIFKSKILEKNATKYLIKVNGFNKEDTLVFTGSFYCVITEKHVLE